MRARSMFAPMAAAVMVGLLTLPAHAQSGLGKHDKAKQPATPTTPATPAAPTKTQPAPNAPAAPAVNFNDLKVGPYVQKDRGRDVVLRVRVHVNSDSPNETTTYRDPFTGKTVDMPKITPFEFTSLSVLWPAIPSTSSSDQAPNAIAGRLMINDQPVSTRPVLIGGYPGGVQFARFDTGPEQQQITCRQVDLEVTQPMRVYRTNFDEKAAIRVPWPTGAWPLEAQSIMKPQLYIETGLDAGGNVRPYDDKAVTDAVDLWLKDAHLSGPRGVSPVALAKILTARVWGFVQISGEGRASKRTGEFAGLMLNPPSEALKTGRCSDVEAAALMAAVLRKAGLPTRVVIGWEGGTGDAKFLQKSSTRNRIRTWVEFCLYDEAKGTVNWVPVDVARLRRMGSRPFALDREWNYFGSHDELDGVMPFAFQFVPPTDVASYGYPAFWGWFATPQAPRQAEQALTFDSATAAATGDDQNAPPSRNKGKTPPEVKRGGN